MKRVQDRWKCVCKTSLQILIYTFLLLLSPLLLFILLLLFGYKYGILRLIVKYFKPKLLQGLNEGDAFYATDQFWGDSRSSSALVLILNGNLELEKIREDFLKKVVRATSPAAEEDSCDKDKLFPRLTQIPQSFGGYYFWQKANYFLIHEHIRPIKTPIDEAGLKKFAGTVLTLPYPNKRPLWEILLFSSYDKHGHSEKKVRREERSTPTLEKEKSVDVDLEGGCGSELIVPIPEEDGEKVLPPIPTKSKCSALVIRMHASIGDTDSMMRMVALLCNRNNYSAQSLKMHSLQSLKLPDCVSDATNTGKNGSLRGTQSLASSTSTPKCSNRVESDQPSRDVVTRIRNLLKLPRNIHSFLESFFLQSSPSLQNLYSSDNNNPTTVSWGSINYPQISKIVQGQGVQRSGLVLSTILGALTDALPSLQIQPDSPDGDCEEMNHGENKTTNYVTLSIMCSMKCAKHAGGHCEAEGFAFLKHYGDYSSESESWDLNRLRNINDQLLSTEENQLRISQYWLKLLSLFPHPFVKYVNLHWMQGATIISQECKTDLCQLLCEPRTQHSLRREVQENDLIFIGDHQLLDLSPVCGLMFRHSAIAVSALKFQNAIKLSVTINSSLMPELEISTMPRSRSSSLRPNQILDKQARADQIVNNFVGEQLDKIY